MYLSRISVPGVVRGREPVEAGLATGVFGNRDLMMFAILAGLGFVIALIGMASFKPR